MAFDPVFLSRLQFGFVITFHIIFPSFTIGLGAWLATIEGARLATGNPVYRRVFDFWLKVFALSFGMGVVTGEQQSLQSLKKSGPFFPMLTRWLVSNGSSRRSIPCAGTVRQRIQL